MQKLGTIMATMENSIIEAQYPLSFRKQEAERLGRHLKKRDSVVLTGMKRVGISSFLRFFLYHEKIVRTYISPTEKHIFIPVDLNDLVEKEIFPFWRLTFKRIVDFLEASTYPQALKKEVNEIFSYSIQFQDLFLTIDGVRKSLVKLVEAGIFPNIFFLRFDRIKDAVTPEFFDNLQGLKDATHQKLSYVFTSYRSLDVLAPKVFTKTSLSTFAYDMSIKPAQKEDTETIYKTYRDRYELNLSRETEQNIFDLVDGYVQYLQLSLIFLHERKKLPDSKEELFNNLMQDERISLQSDELWESLTEKEQKVLMKVSRKEKISSEEEKGAKYLWDTGFVSEKNGAHTAFSPLFDKYLKQRHTKSEVVSVEFTKKEHGLFILLKECKDQICEREKIIETVWPEVEAFGVSDWAIDRLVARVRNKLKQQQSQFEIQTIKTRGYKLIDR